MTRIESLDAELMDNIYLINKGIRTCYFGALHTTEGEYFYLYDFGTFMFEDILEIFKEEVTEFDLYMFTNKSIENEDIFYHYWIYKYPHQKIILEKIYNEEGDNYLRQWMIGKLLGYSDQSMEDFLSNI